jgi:hypothetical protein
MSTYRNKETGQYPVHIGDIELEFPNISEQEILEKFDLVEDTPMPEHGIDKVVKEGQLQKVNGIWKKSWIIEDKPLNDKQEEENYLFNIDPFYKP